MDIEKNTEYLVTTDARGRANLNKVCKQNTIYTADVQDGGARIVLTPVLTREPKPSTK